MEKIKGHSLTVKEARMICPYCSMEFSPEMESKYISSSEGCDTCGYGASTTVSIEIHCTFCDKLVYKKEIEARD